MKPAYVYKPEDYIGELNLAAMERRIIIRELTKAQGHEKASVSLNLSLRTVFRKLLSHQIKDSEWKIPKEIVPKKLAVPKAVKLKPWKNT